MMVLAQELGGNRLTCQHTQARLATRTYQPAGNNTLEAIEVSSHKSIKFEEIIELSDVE